MQKDMWLIYKHPVSNNKHEEVKAKLVPQQMKFYPTDRSNQLGQLKKLTQVRAYIWIHVKWFEACFFLKQQPNEQTLAPLRQTH